MVIGIKLFRNTDYIRDILIYGIKINMNAPLIRCFMKSFYHFKVGGRGGGDYANVEKM